MSVIAEAFGYPPGDSSAAAEASRASVWCPFMGKECDGGGNRFMSAIDLSDVPPLKKLYPKRAYLPAGVCSLQIRAEESPCIVCPRRLLHLGGPDSAHLDSEYVRKLLTLGGFHGGDLIAVWPEVKVCYRSGDAAFDYTFDYVLSRVRPVDAAQNVSAASSKAPPVRSVAVSTGPPGHMTPEGPPLILEIMTLSTSGASGSKRTQTAEALEDALLGKPHKGPPGINYRQVLSRMLLQMVPKGWAARTWGGTTIWVVQDYLTRYITSSTGLNLPSLVSSKTAAVNIQTITYRQPICPQGREPAPLVPGPLYTSSLQPPGSGTLFDIFHASIYPPVTELHRSLRKKEPAVLLRLG